MAEVFAVGIAAAAPVGKRVDCYRTVAAGVVFAERSAAVVVARTVVAPRFVGVVHN